MYNTFQMASIACAYKQTGCEKGYVQLVIKTK